MGNEVSIRDRKLSMINVIEKLSAQIKYLMLIRQFDNLIDLYPDMSA